MSERYLKGVNYMPRLGGKYEAMLSWSDGEGEFRILDYKSITALKEFLFGGDAPSESRLRALDLSGHAEQT